MFKEFIKECIQDIINNSFVEYELDDYIINDITNIIADDETIWDTLNNARGLKHESLCN